MPPDDRQLLTAFARGDQSAFAAIVERHGPLVWGVCRRATSSEPLAEDAFQAVFVVLARRAKGLHLRTSLANWLFGVACKVANRAAQREYRRKLRERTVARPADNAAPEADRAGPEWADTLRVLDEELAKLSEKYRGPLVACYLQGKTQDEAAAELGWTVFTLRRRLAAARELLRERLTRRGTVFFAALFAGAVFASTGFAASPPTGLTAKTLATASAPTLPASVASLIGVSAVPVLVTAGVGVAALVVAVFAVVFASGSPPSTVSNTSSHATPITTPDTTPTVPTAPEWVTVRGRVVWKGDIPKTEVLTVTGADKPACCANGPLASNALLIDPNTRGVRNVVVWLRPDSDDRAATWPKEKVHPTLRNAVPRSHTLDQPNCQFEPRILATRDGDSLLIKNSSAIKHNVTFTDRWAVDISRTLSASEVVESDPLSADTIPMSIRCTIHPWMQAHLRVFDHPYFAVTDADGRFEVKLAPAGKCRVVYWHERGFHQGKAGALGFATELRGDTDLPAVELELPMP